MLPIKTPCYGVINVTDRRRGHVSNLGKEQVSENCPYRLIWKCFGHVLIVLSISATSPTENNELSGIIFDAKGSGHVDKVQEEK